MADQPIEVNPSAIPTSVATALRYALTFLAGISVVRQVLPADMDVNAVIGAIVAMVSAAWGVYAAIRNNVHKNKMLPYTPDRVAKLKR